MSAYLDLTKALVVMAINALPPNDGWTRDEAYRNGHRWFVRNLREYGDPSYDAVPDEIPERLVPEWERGWNEAADEERERRERASEDRHYDTRIF